MGSMLLDIIVLICLAYLGLALFLYYMQPRFLYEPIRQIPYTPAELGLDFEEVYFKTGDRLRLHGWFVPAPNAKFTVLYCHGNGGNMMYFLETVNFLNNLGLNCFVFDYRGYGKSQGAPSENGTYLDAGPPTGGSQRKKVSRRNKSSSSAGPSAEASPPISQPKSNPQPSLSKVPSPHIATLAANSTLICP